MLSALNTSFVISFLILLSGTASFADQHEQFCDVLSQFSKATDSSAGSSSASCSSASLDLSTQRQTQWMKAYRTYFSQKKNLRTYGKATQEKFKKYQDTDLGQLLSGKTKLSVTDQVSFLSDVAYAVCDQLLPEPKNFRDPAPVHDCVKTMREEWVNQTANHHLPELSDALKEKSIYEKALEKTLSETKVASRERE